MEVFGENSTATLLCLGGLVLIIGTLLLRTQRYYAQHQSPRPSIALPSRLRPLERAHHLDSIGPAAAWEVEMHEVARRLSGQLDSKMIALEELVREADRAAARLEAAIAAAPQPAPAVESSDDETPEVAPPTAGPSEPKPAEDAAEPVDQAEEFHVDPELPPEPSTEPQKTRQRRHEEVYTLADYGLDAVEIARRTGHPVGEIQLILALRRPKAT